MDIRMSVDGNVNILACKHTNTWSQLTGAKDIAVGVKFQLVTISKTIQKNTNR